MYIKYMLWIQCPVLKKSKETREVFLRKKHSCGFIFSKLCSTPIFLIHIFSIK